MIQSQRLCALNPSWDLIFFLTHFAPQNHTNFATMCFNSPMSTQNNPRENHPDYNSQGRVKVTDLLSRLNEEKKIEKKRNLALGVAAVSAVTVFGIILTI